MKETKRMKGRTNITSEEDYGDYTTRCICSFTHDDGYMICCDECSVWQHVECMEVDPSNLPDKYLCELCEPRPTDSKKAKIIQTKKKEEMSGTDFDDDDSASMSADDGHRSASSSPGPASSLAKRKKKAQKTMTAGTLRVQELKAEARRSGKKDKGEKEDIKKGKKKPKHHIPHHHHHSSRVHSPNSSPLPSMLTGVQTLLTAASALEQQQQMTTPSATPSQGPWSSSVSPWQDSFETIETNRYTEPLRMSLSSCLSQLKQEAVVYSKEEYHSLGPHPSCSVKEVSSYRKGVMADEHIPEDEMIIEYKGRIATRQGLLAEMGLSSTRLLWKNKPCPFIYQYDKMSDIPICIDARHYGNTARFIRRSCNPNAELRHFFVNNEVHFGVNALHHISPDEEITLAFDFYDKCDYPIECACGHSTSCLLVNSPRVMVRMKGGRKKLHKEPLGGDPETPSAHEEESFHRKGQKSGRGISTHTLDEDSNSSWTSKRMRHSFISHQQQLQASREASDSDSDDNIESDTPKRRKSREERKTEAVWKMFEKMEATKRRRQQHLLSESSSHDGDNMSPSSHINNTPKTTNTTNRESNVSNGRGKVRLLPTSATKLRISSVSSIDMQSPEPMDAFHSPPLTPSLSTVSLPDAIHPLSSSDFIPATSPPSWSSLPKLSFEVTPYLHPKYLLANFALPRKKAILHQWEMEQYEASLGNHYTTATMMSGGFALAYAKSMEGHRPRLRGCLKHRWMKQYEETYPSLSTNGDSSFIHYKKKFLHKWENDLDNNEKTYSLKSPRVTMATNTSSLATDTDIKSETDNHAQQQLDSSRQDPILLGQEPIPSGQEPILQEQDSKPSIGQDPIPSEQNSLTTVGQNPIPPVERQEPIPLVERQEPIPPVERQEPIPSTKQDIGESVPSSPLFDDFSDDDEFDDTSKGGVKSLRDLARQQSTENIIKEQEKEVKKEEEEEEEKNEEREEQNNEDINMETCSNESNNDEFQINTTTVAPPQPTPLEVTTPLTDTPISEDESRDNSLPPPEEHREDISEEREDEMDISLTPPPPMDVMETQQQDEESHPLITTEQQETSMLVEGGTLAELESIRLADEDKPLAKRKMSLLEYRNRSKRPSTSTPSNLELSNKASPSPNNNEFRSTITTTSTSTGILPSSPLSTSSSLFSSRSLLSFSSSFLSDPSQRQQLQGTPSGGVINSEASGRTSQFEPISPDEPQNGSSEQILSSSKTTPLPTPPIVTSVVASLGPSSYGMTTPTTPGQFVWPTPHSGANIDMSQDPRNRIQSLPPQHHELYHQAAPQQQGYPPYLPPPPNPLSLPSLMSHPPPPPPHHQIMMPPQHSSRPTGYLPHPPGPRHY